MVPKLTRGIDGRALASASLYGFAADRPTGDRRSLSHLACSLEPSNGCPGFGALWWGGRPAATFVVDMLYTC